MALLWLTPLASICACFAAIHTLKIAVRSGSWSELSRGLCAAPCIDADAGMIYQPMLAFYWTAVLVFVLDPRFLKCERYFRSVLLTFVAGLFYFICCFLLMKACFAVSGVEPKARTSYYGTLFPSCTGFFRIQLPMALNYWQLVVSGSRWVPLGTALATGSLISCGYLLFLRRYRRRVDSSQVRTSVYFKPMVFFTLFIAMLMGLSHVHWFAIEDSPQSYRIIAPLGLRLGYLCTGQ